MKKILFLVLICSTSFGQSLTEKKLEHLITDGLPVVTTTAEVKSLMFDDPKNPNKLPLRRAEKVVVVDQNGFLKYIDAIKVVTSQVSYKKATTMLVDNPFGMVHGFEDVWEDDKCYYEDLEGNIIKECYALLRL